MAADFGSDFSPALLIAAFSVATSAATLLSWFLKGQEYVEKATIKVLRSEDGREAILRVTRDHIDVKLDALNKSVEGVGQRIETMSGKLERRLDKLDSDMQTMNVRVTLLEKRSDT